MHKGEEKGGENSRNETKFMWLFNYQNEDQQPQIRKDMFEIRTRWMRGGMPLHS